MKIYFVWAISSQVLVAHVGTNPSDGKYEALGSQSMGAPMLLHHQQK